MKTSAGEEMLEAVFSVEQVAQHNSRQSCWVALHDSVYVFTPTRFRLDHCRSVGRLHVDCNAFSVLLQPCSRLPFIPEQVRFYHVHR